MRLPLIPDHDPPTEPATAAGFDSAGYLLANPDVAAWGGDPREHLERHGLAEGRTQVSRAYLSSLAERRRAKFARFRDLLGPGYRFLEGKDAFPILYGDAPLSLDRYERESANAAFSAFTDAVAADGDGLYADIGCGRRDRHLDNCLYLEVYPSRSADVIMVPDCRYPFADGGLDGIGCFAVLEHVAAPWTAAAEFRRMLRPGGRVWIDWPFLQPVHGYPAHYYNATRDGLAAMFADGFEAERLDTLDSQAPDRALTWILRGWAASLTDEAVRADFLGRTVSDLLAEPRRSPFWQAVLAATPPAARTTYAAGNTLIARKTA